MKILQVIDVFSPSAGGSADVAGRLSLALSRLGHEVTVYTSDLGLNQVYVNSMPEIKIHPFPSSFSPGGKPLLMPGLSRHAKSELGDFDIIHLHNYPTLTNVTVGRLARKYHVPYVLQAHGSLATYFRKGFSKRLYDTLWGRSILKHAAAVIAVAPPEAETYRRMKVPREKIEVVPNGVDAAAFQNLPLKGGFRRKHSLEGRKLVFYLGRIHATKGLDLLAGAFSALSRDISDASLIIAGPDDGYLPALRRLVKALDIQNKTLFTGPLYGNAKLQAFVDADVSVLPSSYEIFGIAALEACLCGTQVVVTDRCGIAPEITADLGQVVAYDKDALTTALLKALAAPPPDAAIVEKRRLALLDRFSWDKLAVRVENIYRDIIAKRAARARI